MDRRLFLRKTIASVAGFIAVPLLATEESGAAVVFNHRVTGHSSMTGVNVYDDGFIYAFGPLEHTATD